MKIEIWSDVVCPFCYIGKRRFEKALASFDAKDKVEIEWKSFQLDPDLEYIPGQSVHEYLGKRKGTTAVEGKRMNDAMTAMAKEAGLEYNFDKAVVNNTFNAHRLLHFAKEKGLQNEMKEHLFRGYYTEGKNVGDIETLAQLGEEVGLQADEVKDVLQSDKYAQDVLLDQYKAQQLGIQGVPFYVFNNKYGVSGAQSPETFAQVLEKVWEEEKPVLITEQGEGFCTVDGNCN